MAANPDASKNGTVQENGINDMDDTSTSTEYFNRYVTGRGIENNGFVTDSGVEYRTIVDDNNYPKNHHIDGNAGETTLCSNDVTSSVSIWPKSDNETFPTSTDTADDTKRNRGESAINKETIESNSVVIITNYAEETTMRNLNIEASFIHNSVVSEMESSGTLCASKSSTSELDDVRIDGVNVEMTSLYNYNDNNIDDTKTVNIPSQPSNGDTTRHLPGWDNHHINRTKPCDEMNVISGASAADNDTITQEQSTTLPFLFRYRSMREINDVLKTKLTRKTDLSLSKITDTISNPQSCRTTTRL